MWEFSFPPLLGLFNTSGISHFGSRIRYGMLWWMRSLELQACPAAGTWKCGCPVLRLGCFFSPFFFFFFLFSNPKEQWFALICSFTLLQHRHSAGIPFVRILQLLLLFGSLLVFFFLLLGKGWGVGGEMSVGRWGEGQKLTRVSEGVFYWKIILWVT